jgi:ABC-type glycerol-3-phosphate transport system substrate-binding protein
MWKRRGLLYALDVLDELVKADNGYQHTLSMSVNFTTAQGYFCLPENKIAMMPNGDWLYNEMKTNYPKANLRMMALPVVSAIRHHPDCEGTIANDAELSALIAAIDAGETAISGTGYNVSEKAFNKIYSARKMYGCGPNIQSLMVTPTWSDSKELVKQFMLYIASDEGQIKMAQSGAGFTLGFDMSETVRNAVMASANDFVKESQAIKFDSEVAPMHVYKSRLFSLGGMSVWPTIELGYQQPELIFSLEGKGYMDAETVWSQNYQNAKSKWATYMQTAGLSN